MALAVVAASVALSLLLVRLAFFQALEKKAYDLALAGRTKIPQAAAAAHPPAAITLVNIDAETADDLAKPPELWPREFGEVLRAATAGGAKVIGLDFHFRYPVTQWDEAGDPLFLQSYSDATQHGVPVILAYEPTDRGRVRDKSVPVYVQALADGNVGYAELHADSDGRVRTLEWQSGSALSFAARVAVAMKGPAALSAIPAVSPNAMPNAMAIRPHDAIPAISMRKILVASRDADMASLSRWFKGRVVLIGPPEDASTQSAAISTIVQGDFLRPASSAQRWTFLVAATILATLAGLALPSLLRLLGCALLIALVMAAAVVAGDRGLILPSIAAQLAVVLATIGSYGVDMLRPSQRALTAVERAFTGAVSEADLRLLAEAGDAAMDSRRCELTVMSCTIRGFLATSEDCDPTGSFLDFNDYLKAMSDAVLKNGGTAGKFIEDGIVALFGAPVPHPDHAHRAVLCAQQIVVAVDILNARRAATGLDQWQVAIGIDTGEAVVGLVGALDRRVEYTVNGGAIRIAARLESLNQTLGTQILLSEATRDRMGVDIATTWKGAQAVPGRDEPEQVYTV